MDQERSGEEREQGEAGQEEREDQQRDDGGEEQRQDDGGEAREGDDGSQEESGDGADEQAARPSISAREMTQAAMEALEDLTGHKPEAATGLQYDGGSWLVTVDVLELSRIPETTDLMATYVVQLDGDGNLSGYKRTKRFQRAQAEEG